MAQIAGVERVCYVQADGAAKICYQLPDIKQLVVIAKDGEHVIFEKKEAAE